MFLFQRFAATGIVKNYLTTYMEHFLVILIKTINFFFQAGDD